MSLTPFHTSNSPKRFLPTPRNSNNLSGLGTGALRRRLLSRHGAHVENSPPLTVFVLLYCQSQTFRGMMPKRLPPSCSGKIDDEKVSDDNAHALFSAIFCVRAKLGNQHRSFCGQNKTRYHGCFRAAVSRLADQRDCVCRFRRGAASRGRVAAWLSWQ